MIKFNFKKFGKHILYLRESLEYNNSLRQISKKIGIAHTTLNRAEQGNIVDVNNLLNICEFYCIRYDEIENYYIEETQNTYIKNE